MHDKKYRRYWGFLAGLLIISLSNYHVHAEIEKKAAVAEEGILLFGWPKLSIPEGWHHDHEHSLSGGINILAKDGNTFVDSDAIIYGRALYKPNCPEFKTLADLIATDRKTFDEQGASIKEAAPIRTADGQQLSSLTFFPKTPTASGNWERVAYGEEDEYYLVFVLSARTGDSYEASLAVFEKILMNYR